MNKITKTLLQKYRKKEEVILNKIKEFRNKKKLTQIELSQKMKVKQNTISDWENGNKMPNVIKAIQLAELLDTTVEKLYK